MIVDCHTHVWESVERLGRWTEAPGPRARGGQTVQFPKAGPREHLAATKPVDRAFVLALKSYYLEAEIANDYVADYVRQHAERLIGVACVDPTRPGEAVQELRRAYEELDMRAVVVCPAAQDFHPAATAAMRVYAEAGRLHIPVLFHQDAVAAGKMEYARPYLLDEVAREFDDLKIVIAQLGHPWVEETIVLLAKHRNVFADISGLISRPWHAYQALLSAFQAGVMENLLFGSDFPYNSAAACIEALYSINQVCHGTNLPTIPREQLRQIVERDSLKLLDLEAESKPAPAEPDTTLIRSEE